MEIIKSSYSISRKMVFSTAIAASLLLTGCSGSLNKDAGAVLYNEANNPAALYPQVKFDTEAARAALAPGKSTIKGRACFKYGRSKYSPDDIRVTLYPVTPYLEAWYKLRNKNQDREVSMSPEALAMRIDVKTNANGDFIFPEMLPGKYFIQLYWYFNRGVMGSVYVGSSYSQYGGTVNHYRNQQYSVGSGGLLENFIEIKRDGDTETMTMSNKTWNMGCHLWH